MMETTKRERAAGLLLAAGWVVFWCGAINPLAMRLWGQAASMEEFLGVVAAEPVGWIAIAASFAGGTLLTATGWTVLATALRERGDGLWCELARTAYLFGAVLWIAALAFRATATVSAATELADAGAVPAWFVPISDWASALFAVYMVLAYLSIAGFGAALGATARAPRWSKVMIGFGLVAAAGFCAGLPVFGPPLMVHPVPGIFGAVLALRPGRATTV